MKVLSASQQRKADQYTIANEPIRSIDLMERAASKCVEWILLNSTRFSDSVIIFVGTGNNGGDGLVIARKLSQAGKKVRVVIVELSPNHSVDFSSNLDRLSSMDSVSIERIAENRLNDLKLIESDVIIDAILGTGIQRSASGVVASTITLINNHLGEVISIDIPSGLFADQPNGSEDLIVKATVTLTFQSPKLSFLLPPFEDAVGECVILDIGLSADFINECVSSEYLIDSTKLKRLLKKRVLSSHKGTFGHALLIAGSYGKNGAAIMAALGALKSGVGLCTIYSAKNAHDIVQISVPEAMFLANDGEHWLIPSVDFSFLENKTIGIGPGIGTAPETVSFFQKMIENSSNPMVFDADALNILALNKSIRKYIPEYSILTPHPKELERLVGSWRNSFERLELQRKLAADLNSFILVKGHHSSITSPDGLIYFNTTGNPGMATGGSGDVLTGVLTGLLAQGYSSLDACMIGVYLHGLAGDIAANRLGQIGMTAMDIVQSLPNALLDFQKNT